MAEYEPTGTGNRFGKRGSARSEARERAEGKRTDTGFELFTVDCDKCGRKCDIPFKPKSNKPVYCRSCFRGTTPEESGRSPTRDSRDRGSDRFERNSSDRFEPRARNNSAEDLEEISRKLDKVMKALNIKY